MNAQPADAMAPSREQIVHALYEAAELEHNLMCTYLYAAFSLRDGVGEGLTVEEAAAVARWRRRILDVAVDEMGHLVAVWNITSALGGAPRFGRGNFPLDSGYLPASVVVRLAPFDSATLQHFVFLERPGCSSEADGEGFIPERQFRRRRRPARYVTPMAIDYDTVGTFYETLGAHLRRLSETLGESAAFPGDPALQLSTADSGLRGMKPVICLKTALGAFDAIVTQGEGAAAEAMNSHYHSFLAIRDEYQALLAKNPAFRPAWPAAVNPVLREPPNPEGRVWLENPEAITTVDVANSGYQLMMRLLAYAYSVPRPDPEKTLVLSLGIGLMQAIVPLAEHAVRLPAGPSSPGCNAGMSFTALRDSAPLPRGPAARRFFLERLDELIDALAPCRAKGARRVEAAIAQLEALKRQAGKGFTAMNDAEERARAQQSTAIAAAAAAATASGDSAAAMAGAAAVDVPMPPIEHVPGKQINIEYEGKRCIHARFCVTGAPKVFLANVKGPWIHPDDMDAERLVEVAHACPSGAIRYTRNDGRPNETAPPVNLASIREGGPYAFRAALSIDGQPPMFRATLCRCGASKNKPYCDGSHHDVKFDATGEPPSTTTDMLPVRDGELHISPKPNGPLQVSGNLEITSGTGRVVARVTTARLCRCGGSASKPFCDGTHSRIGFVAD